MFKEIIRPTRYKILLDLALTALYLITIFSVPAWGYAEKFANLAFTSLILSICLSLALVAIVYYPLVCGLFGIYKSMLKPVNYRRLLISAIIVLIFNPLTFHLIAISFIKSQPSIENQQIKTCGLVVISFTEFSKAEASGLMVGDIVTGVDGTKINSVDDLIKNSQKKRPGDMTDLNTNRGTFKLEVISDPNNHGPVLGIKFNGATCQ